MYVILANFEWWQVAATVHTAVIGFRADVILSLVLEVLFQIAASSENREYQYGTCVEKRKFEQSVVVMYIYI